MDESPRFIPRASASAAERAWRAATSACMVDCPIGCAVAISSVPGAVRIGCAVLMSKVTGVVGVVAIIVLLPGLGLVRSCSASCHQNLLLCALLPQEFAA